MSCSVNACSCTKSLKLQGPSFTGNGPRSTSVRKETRLDVLIDEYARLLSQKYHGSAEGISGEDTFLDDTMCSACRDSPIPNEGRIDPPGFVADLGTKLVEFNGKIFGTLRYDTLDQKRLVNNVMGLLGSSEHSIEARVTSITTRVAALCGSLLVCETITQYMAAMGQFLASFVTPDVVTALAQRYHLIPNEGPVAMLGEMRKFLSNTRSLKVTFFESPLYKFFADAVGILALAGLCDGIGARDLIVLSAESTKAHADRVKQDVPEVILQTLEFAFEVAHDWMRNVDLTGFIYGRNAMSTATNLLAKMLDFEQGMLDQKHQITDAHFHMQVQVSLLEMKEYSNRANGSQKSIALITYSKLQVAEANIRAKLSTSGFRERPFCLLFGGGSGVGKSTATSDMCQYLSAAFSIPMAPKNIATVNEVEKFDPVTGHTTTVVFDDMAQTKNFDNLPEYHTSRLVRYNNVVPAMAIKADTQDKSCIPLKPDLIIITTNVPDLSTTAVTKQPEAVYNRINSPWMVRPKDYCRRQDGSLDKTKIRPGDPPIEAAPITYTVTGSKAVSVTVGTYIPFEDVQPQIAREMKIHRAEQKVLRTRFEQSKNVVVCTECFLPEARCTCTTPSLRKPVTNEGLLAWGVGKSRKLFAPGSMDYAKLVKVLNNLSEYLPELTVEPKKWVENAYSFYVTEFILELVHRGERWMGATLILGLLLLPYLYMLPRNMKILIFCWLLYTLYGMVMITRRSLAHHTFDVLVTAVKNAHGDQFKYLDAILFAPMLFVVIASLRSVVNTTKTVWESYRNFASGKKLHDDFAIDFRERMMIGHSPLKSDNEPLPTPPLPEQQGNLMPRTLKEMDERHNEPDEWAKPGETRSDIVASYARRTTSVEDTKTKVRRYLYHMRAPGKTSGTMVNCTALRVSGTWVLVPRHSFELMDVTQKIRMYKELDKTDSVFDVRFDMRTRQNVCNDHVAISAAGLTTTGDILDFFPESVSPGKRQVSVILPDDRESELIAELRHEIKTESSTITGFAGDGAGDTRPGDCCSPWISRGEVNVIVGLHNGRAGTFMVSELILKKDLEFMTKPLMVENEGFEMDISPPPSLKSIETQCYDEDIYGGPEVDPRAASNFTTKHPDGRTPIVTCYGGVPTQRAKGVSKIVSTSLSPELEKEGLPQKWGKPKMNPNRNFSATLQKAQHPVQPIDPEAMHWAVQDYSRDLVAKIHELKAYWNPLTMFEAFNGRRKEGQNIKKMNLNTSPGIGLSGKKLDHVEVHEDEGNVKYTPKEHIETEVERLLEPMSRRERVAPISKGALKDEPTPLDKDKVRVFFVMPMAFLIIGRMVMCPIIAFLTSVPLLSEQWFGIRTTTSEWAQTYEYLAEISKTHIMNGDYGAYDQSFSTQLIWGVSQVFQLLGRAMGFSEYWLNVLYAWMGDIASPIYAFNGTLLSFLGYQPSGNPATVVINGIGNSLLHRIFFYTMWMQHYGRPPDIGAFRKYCHFGFVGDDSVGSVSPMLPWMNMISYQRWLASIGMKYTMPDKKSKMVSYVTLDMASLCKRMWRVVEYVPPFVKKFLRLVHAPIEIDSILKSFHCLHKFHDDEWLVLKCNVISGFRELARHPQPIFEDVKQRVLNALARMQGVPPMPELERSYEFWQHDIIERYHNGNNDEELFDSIEDQYLLDRLVMDDIPISH